MNIHQYSSEEALDTLMRKLQEQDEDLAILVRSAIDEGKETIITIESIHNRGRSKKSHEYRKIVPFTHEEALQVALKVLQGFFIEGPLLTNEIIRHFSDTSETHDVPEIQIELRTETQIDGGDGQEFRLTRVPNEGIEEQRHNLASLKELITFSGG